MSFRLSPEVLVDCQGIRVCHSAVWLIGLAMNRWLFDCHLTESCFVLLPLRNRVLTKIPKGVSWDMDGVNSFCGKEAVSTFDKNMLSETNFGLNFFMPSLVSGNGYTNGKVALFTSREYNVRRRFPGPGFRRIKGAHTEEVAGFLYSRTRFSTSKSFLQRSSFYLRSNFHIMTCCGPIE